MWEYTVARACMRILLKKPKCYIYPGFGHIECILLVAVSAVGLGMSLISFSWKKVSGHMKKVRIYGVLIRQF